MYIQIIKSNLKISPNVREKLASRNITEKDICECFLNVEGEFLEDEREDHKSDPASLWFVSETNSKRLLKVVFIESEDKIIIKTTYDANKDEIRIYNKYAC